MNEKPEAFVQRSLRKVPRVSGVHCTGISGGGVHVTDAVQHATFLLDERNCHQPHTRPCCLGTSVFASTVGYNVVGPATPCFR